MLIVKLNKSNAHEQTTHSKLSTFVCLCLCLSRSRCFCVFPSVYLTFDGNNVLLMLLLCVLVQIVIFLRGLPTTTTNSFIFHSIFVFNEHLLLRNVLNCEWSVWWCLFVHTNRRREKYGELQTDFDVVSWRFTLGMHNTMCSAYLFLFKIFAYEWAVSELSIRVYTCDTLVNFRRAPCDA